MSPTMALLSCIDLAQKTVDQGFSLSGGPESWTAFHLAQTVLVLVARLDAAEPGWRETIEA